MIKEYQPEAVVLATGSAPIIPEEYQGKANIVTALEVLGGQKTVREKVVVVGGGMVGCEVAEFLAKRYKDITILEMLPEIGSDIGPSIRANILKRIKSTGIKLEAGIKITEITETGVRGLRMGQSEFFNSGTIVIAVGMKSEKQLVGELEGFVPEIHLIGDGMEPRRIREAIADGYRAGLKI